MAGRPLNDTLVLERMLDDDELDKLLSEWPILPSSDSPLGDKKHLSPTQLKMASRCLEQYRRRYVKGIKDAPAGALIWGRSDHATIEVTMREKLTKGEHLSVPDTVDLFAATLEREVNESGGVAEVDWGNEKGEKVPAEKGYAQAMDVGTRLVGAYREQVAPTIVPVTIEEPFEVQVPGIGVPVAGYIDLIGRQDRTPRLIERKTTARNTVSGEWKVQTRVMQLARPYESDIQLSLKQKTPRVVAGVHLSKPMPAAAVHAQIQRIVAEIALCWARYGPDEPWPDAIGRGSACDWCAWGPNRLGDCAWWNPMHWSGPSPKRGIFAR